MAEEPYQARCGGTDEVLARGSWHHSANYVTRRIPHQVRKESQPTKCDLNPASSTVRAYRLLQDYPVITRTGAIYDAPTT